MRRVSSAVAFVIALLALAPVALAKKTPAKIDVRIENMRVAATRVHAPRADAKGDVGLTLDPALQRAVERILAASKAPSGAVVVSDVQTGRILAWASRGTEGDLVRTAKYPGASLFKVATTVALLEEDKIKLGDTVCYSGGEHRLTATELRPGCHSGDQRVRFESALGRSLNAVFGKLAVQHLTPSKLTSTAKALGIGDMPPLDLPVDKTSIKIPEDELGLARAAAGFGEARMSPLGALFLMQTIANGGERVRLHVTGNPADVPRVTLGRAFSKETSKELVRMLEVTTRSGTSAKAFAPKEGRAPLSVAGKTGTLLYENPKRLVSWFAGFAPSRSPEVAVAVLLANDEKWWRKGNDVARDVLDAYFELQKKPR